MNNNKVIKSRTVPNSNQNKKIRAKEILNSHNNKNSPFQNLQHFDFTKVQGIFNSLYVVIVGIIIFFICLVVIISILIMIIIIISKFVDSLKIKFNKQLSYRDLNKFLWYKYFYFTYDNYSIFDDTKFVYLQQMILNTGIFWVTFMFILLIANGMLYFSLLFTYQDVTGNFQEELDKNLLKIYAVCFLFCVVMSIIYSLLFKTFVYNPVYDMTNSMKNIDDKIDKNIIKNKDVINEAINGSVYNALEKYFDELPDDLKGNFIIQKKIIFTYNIITHLKNSMSNKNDVDLLNQIRDYLIYPTNNDTNFFSFLNINSYMIFQANSSLILDILGNSIDDTNKLKIMNEIKNDTDVIERDLKIIHKHFDDIDDISYVIIFAVLSVILFVCLYAYFKTYNDNTIDPHTLIFNSFSKIFNFIVDNFILLFKIFRKMFPFMS